MQTISLSCNHCGAPLQVAESTRFVTCTHCSSRLRIESSGGAAYTEVLEEIRSSHKEMASDLETIRLQNELERIDREWSQEQRGFETIDKHGRRSLPSGGNTVGMVLGGLFAVGFVIFWIAMSSSIGAPGIFPVFGVAMLVFVVFGVVKGMRSASEYSDAERRHRARRRKVLNDLRERGALLDEDRR